MSAAERERLVVVRQVIEGRLTQAVGAERLGLGVRQVKRLVRAYRGLGAKGLVSRQRGRVSPRRLDGAKRAEIAGLLAGKYQGFGPTLAAEKLGALEAIRVSRETVRGLQIAHGLWRAKRRRQARVFSPRERRARFGELIQIDGSPHDWFEGRAPRASLIVFIDDATGQLTGLRFAPAESTRAYLETLRTHVLAHGLPLALYSDRHGIFRVNAKDAASGDGKTEFGRVAERLGIELIHAQTPQAKGRVERANQTLQDRLVKEMRLEGISGIAAANAFLPGFMDSWNARFAVAPREPAPAHRPWTKPPEALDAALAHHDERTLSKNLTFRAQGRLHAIKTKGPGTALRGARVNLLTHLDGRIEVHYKQRILETSVFGPCRAPQAAEDDKSLDARIDAIIAAAPPGQKPASQAIS